MIVTHANGLVGFEIADDSPLAITIRTRDIKDAAYAKLAGLPQYDGYLDGPEWKLIEIGRTFATKGGPAFTKGEVTLARPPDTDLIALEITGWTAWSATRGGFINVPTGWFKAVAA